MTVAGGLTLGGAGVAAAQTYAAAPQVAMQPYPPRPFEPFALVFLDDFSDDPFDALAGLSREGRLLGPGLGGAGLGGAGGGGADGGGADGRGGRGTDGRGADGRGADGRGADGRGDRGADGLDKADKADKADTVVQPATTTVVPVGDVQGVEPETVNTANCSNGNCGPTWWGNGPQWNNTGPGAWTSNDTQNNDGAQPIIGPGSPGSDSGVLPVQNAAQASERSPEDVAELPAEDFSEDESEEEPEESTDEDYYDEDYYDEDMPMGMNSGQMGGGGPAPAAAGPQLPFTGAPMGVAAAGAGLLAVALGCTMLSARRRRSTDAK
ncbi:hypothetical protein AB0C14_18420 [Microbispora hainanensis]|uniref:hypothetical protein n=1 Tax=Microbispora hainanensis TaxID=568844 RepID=UPI0033EE7A75